MTLSVNSAPSYYCGCGDKLRPHPRMHVARGVPCAKVFSAKSSFTPIRESFLPRKIPAIRYGTAMGSPVSVSIANLVMEDVEERALASYDIQLPFWKRYVHDVFTVVRIDRVPHLLAPTTMASSAPFSSRLRLRMMANYRSWMSTSTGDLMALSTHLHIENQLTQILIP